MAYHLLELQNWIALQISCFSVVIYASLSLENISIFIGVFSEDSLLLKYQSHSLSKNKADFRTTNQNQNTKLDGVKILGNIK
jgi:hypothetical protein